MFCNFKIKLKLSSLNRFYWSGGMSRNTEINSYSLKHFISKQWHPSSHTRIQTRPGYAPTGLWERLQEIGVEGLIYRGKYLQQRSSELHLSFLVYSQEERNMYKERLDPIMLRKAQRMIVYVIANKSTRIIWDRHFVPHFRQRLRHLLDWKRGLHPINSKMEIKVV